MKYDVAALAVIASLMAACTCKGDTRPSGDEQREAQRQPSRADAKPPPPRDDRLKPDDQLAILEACSSAMNEGDAEAFGDCYAEGAILELADAVPEIDPAPAALFAELRGAFPDLQIERQLVVLGGSSAATAYLLEGTHEGALWGIEPTGRRVSVLGGQVAHMNKAGRITRDTHYLDQATIRAQLGDREAARAPRVEQAWPEPVHVVASPGDGTADTIAAFETGYLRALQEGDIDVMVRSYAEAAERRFVPDREAARGRASIRGRIQAERRGTPDFETRVRRQWGAGDWLVRETAVGGELARPPAGASGASWRQFRLEFFEFDGPAITRHLIFANELGGAAFPGPADEANAK